MEYGEPTVFDNNIKKPLKKLSNTFSFSLLIEQVIAAVGTFLGIVILYIYSCPFSKKSNLLSLLISNRSDFLYYVLNTLVYFTYMFITFVIIAAVLRQHPFKAIPFKITHPELVPYAIIFGIFLSIIGELYSSYFDYLLSFFNLQVDLDYFDIPTNTPSMILFVINISVLAPILEELIFRGLILQNLRKFGNFFAVVVSALLFGILHGNFSQTPLAFVVGIALGFAVIETGSIVTSMIMHCIINSFSVIINGIQMYFGENIANAVYLIYLGAAIILSIIAFILLIRKQFFKDLKSRYFNKDVSCPIAFSVFCKTPGFIIFLSFYLINMFASLKFR